VDFVTVVDQVIALLRQRGRVTYSTLKRQFQLDEAALEDVKNEGSLVFPGVQNCDTINKLCLPVDVSKC
jgi:hypothetical protein